MIYCEKVEQDTQIIASSMVFNKWIGSGHSLE